MVDRAALEMRSTRKGTGGSNPSLSAKTIGFRRLTCSALECQMTTESDNFLNGCRWLYSRESAFRLLICRSSRQRLTANDPFFG